MGTSSPPPPSRLGPWRLVVERELELDVAQVVVADARAAMAPLAARFWGDPTGELKVVGVTGTNGKTTTAFLIREILEAAGTSCGLLGTVKQVVGGVEEEVERTTPEAIDLQATFRRMLESGDRVCAMEVSSHALALHRCDAIHFEVALFTNLTQDHLDFHGDMEDYFRSKRLLFEMGPGSSIVNVDDPYGRRLAGEFECVTFSAEGADADYVARDVSFDAGGADFAVVGPEGETVVRTALPGHFNVANALGAFAAARALGVGAEEAAAGLARAGRVPGRFEPVDEGQSFSVLVDYAIDHRSRNRGQISPPQRPLLVHQAAQFRPAVADERRAHLARHVCDLLEIFLHAPPAVDVILEHFPIVDARLPRLAGVAEHQPPVELLQIARQRFAPFATGCQMDGHGPAERGRIVVLRPRRHANDDCFHVAADVNPVFLFQPGAGEFIERRADRHGHRARTAQPRAGRRLRRGRQREALARAKNLHQFSQQRQLVALGSLQRRQRGKLFAPPGIERYQRDSARAARRSLQHAGGVTRHGAIHRQRTGMK